MKQGLCTLAVSALLVACGGSSGSIESTDNQQGAAQRITGDLKYTSSQCNVTAPITNADIMIHAQDGSIISNHTSNANGHFDIKWPSNAKHLTLAYENLYADGNNHLKVVTRLDTQVGDIGTFSAINESLNSQCNCQQISFDSTELLTQVSSNYSIYLNHYGKSLIGEELSTKVCLDDNKYRPLNLVLADKDGSSDYPSYTLEVDINQFDLSHPISLTSDMFITEKSKGVALNVDYNIFDTSLRKKTFSETEHGRINWLTWSNNPVVFPSFYADNFVTGSRFKQLESNGTADITHYAQRRKRVTDASLDYSIKVPTNEMAWVQQSTEITQTFANENVATNYDFSQIGEGQNVFFLDLEYSSKAIWSIRGPLAGTIPNLDLIEHLKAKLTQISQSTQPNVTLGTYGYYFNGSYHEYRKASAAASRNNQGVRASFFDNYTTESLTLYAY